MSQAYDKDIRRSIKKGWKRFLSIVVITALGVTMMVGLYAGCLDMYFSADQFFDKQNLFDIRVQSTLGLTEEDVAALGEMDGVQAAEGAYSETVHTDLDGAGKSAEMTMLSAKGLNTPHLLQGTLPAKAGEIAVTQKYLDDSGKAIGDTLSIVEDLDAGSAKTAVGDSDLDLDIEEAAETPTFADTVYVITGVVTDALDIQSNGTGTAFRTSVSSDYTFFIPAAAADYDIYSAVYITLAGTAALNSFSDAYENAVQAMVGKIESRIKARREQARYDEIVIEARSKIRDAETAMRDKFAEAEEEFADAWREIAEGKRDLAAGSVTLAAEEKDARRQIAAARAALETAKQKLAAADRELVDGAARLIGAEIELAQAEAELAAGERLLADGEAALHANTQKLIEGKERLAAERRQAETQFAAAEGQFAAAESRLDAAQEQLEAGIAELKTSFGAAWPAQQWQALVTAAAALAAKGADDDAIAAATAAESAALAGALQAQVDVMAAGLSQQVGESQAALDDLNREIAAYQQQLETAVQQLAAAEALLATKTALAAAAQATLTAETEILDNLTAGTPEYEAQSALVAAAQHAWAAARADVAAAEEALAAANGSVLDLRAEGDAKIAAAEQLAAAIEEMEGQAARLVSLPASAVQTGLGMGKVNGGRQALAAQKAAFAGEKEAALGQLNAAATELAAAEAQINAAGQGMAEKKAELEAGKAALAAGRAGLEAGKAELAAGQTGLEAGKTELTAGEATLNAEEAAAATKIAAAWAEIARGKRELAAGEAEFSEQKREYVEKRAEAEQKLADAYVELDDIDMAQWYVQDRTSLDSYSSLNSDLSSIEAIGKVFPALFLVVAVLMSLTTMTRMVEEERGLIGIYKALGYGNAAIYGKYLLFALMACLLGGLLGDLLGFIFFPKFLAVILEELYSLPDFYLRFDALYGIGGILLFMIAILGSTVLACRSELAHMPATLMRPKAPRAGARVFMERIPAIWNRLKFLNKVTVRNLFRYKKRLLMTVGGIAGCTALILCGFAIKDSVADLGPKQYGDVYRYDLLAVFEEEENDALLGDLIAEGQMEDYLNLRIESVKLINGDGKAEKVQLMVVPDGASIESYIRTEDLQGALVHLDDRGVLATQNAARILGLHLGDTVAIQDMELAQGEAVLSGIVKNYLGNHVFMTQDLYERLFGVYAANGVLAQLADTCSDQAAYAESLLDRDSVLSAVSTAAAQEEFVFDLINAVVLLLIVMAGGLAFVVLFTLSYTNISERARELATIKVLGFYDNEVHQYVNKETLLLTMIGIVVGLPLGRFLSGLLTAALKMPSIHFAVHIEPASYLISAAIAFCFAIIVNWITNFTLNRINMVEALKSVE